MLLSYSIESMKDENQIQNLHHYTTIEHLLSLLDKEAGRASDASMYITEMDMHLKALAGLAEYVTDREQEIHWLRPSIGKLRSRLGFNVQ